MAVSSTASSLGSCGTTRGTGGGTTTIAAALYSVEMKRRIPRSSWPCSFRILGRRNTSSTSAKIGSDATSRCDARMRFSSSPAKPLGLMAARTKTFVSHTILMGGHIGRPRIPHRAVRRSAPTISLSLMRRAAFWQSTTPTRSMLPHDRQAKNPPVRLAWRYKPRRRCLTHGPLDLLRRFASHREGRQHDEGIFP
jgi:hypothetical protein